MYSKCYQEIETTIQKYLQVLGLDGTGNKLQRKNISSSKGRISKFVVALYVKTWKPESRILLKNTSEKIILLQEYTIIYPVQRKDHAWQEYINIWEFSSY